jgi:hypothetical protein
MESGRRPESHMRPLWPFSVDKSKRRIDAIHSSVALSNRWQDDIVEAVQFRKQRALLLKLVENQIRDLLTLMQRKTSPRETVIHNLVYTLFPGCQEEFVAENAGDVFVLKKEGWDFAFVPLFSLFNFSH